MASISASLPSFLSSCLGLGRRPQADDQAVELAPRAPSPGAAMEHTGPLSDLYQGAAHSRKKILESTELKGHFEALAKGQSPKYYVIACSDSRVSPPEIFGVRPGTMFEMQHLGALMPKVPHLPIGAGGSVDQEWANVSYAVEELKVQHLIVLGHTGCGAVAGIMSPEAIAHNGVVSPHLATHSDLRERVNERFGHLQGADQALAAVGESVLQTLEKVNAFAPVRKAVDANRLQVHGMVFEIANHGAISEWDPATQEFVLKNASRKGEHSILPRRSGNASVA